jgi:hypothetical protein
MAVNYLGDNSPDGMSVGKSVTEKISFYGVAPIAQRASSVQTSTYVTTSASFGTQQAVVMQEIAQTLIALGLWKGAA